MNTIIIYKGKYGATRQYAKLLAQTLNTTSVDASVTDDAMLRSANIVIAGSAIYIGRLMISAWLHKHKAILEQKQLHLFVVCGTPLSDQQAIKTLIDRNIPAELRHNLSLFFLKGRMIKEKLSFKDRLLLRMGAAFTKDPKAKNNMLRNFDEVKAAHLTPIILAVKSSITEPSEHTPNMKDH